MQQRRKLAIVEEEMEGEAGEGERGWKQRDRGSIMRGETAGVLMITAWRRHFEVLKSPHGSLHALSSSSSYPDYFMHLLIS